MSLEYDELPCPRCGSLNRRFRGPAFLSGRNAWLCDHCGAELASGRFSVWAIMHVAAVHAAAFFFCALLGALAAVLLAALFGAILLGDDYYERHRPAIMNVALAVGVIAGFAVAERNRRRGGVMSRRRVAAGDARTRTAPGAQDAPSVEVVDLSPAARAAVKARTARGWCIGIGYVLGVFGGLVLARYSPVWEDIGGAAGMVAGAVAGWLFGRWKFPDPR